MHVDTEKYLKTLMNNFPHYNELEDGRYHLLNYDVVDLLKLAFYHGYNYGYLAVDVKMIPTEFLQNGIDKSEET